MSDPEETAARPEGAPLDRSGWDRLPRAADRDATERLVTGAGLRSEPWST
jgi:hypothetical protein